MAKRDTGRAEVDAYLAKVPPPFRAVLESLRATIRAAAPTADEGISYGLPAFRQQGPLVYYAAFRDHLSFFPGGAETRRTFAQELAPFGGGRGTVRFTLERPLPKGLVRRIVLARIRENAARQAARPPKKPPTPSRRRTYSSGRIEPPRLPMPKPAETAQERFDRLIVQLDAANAAPSARRRGFGTGSLFVGKKMFGLLDASGALVLKLAPDRVEELLESGRGKGWHPGAGKPLKEYVAIGFSRRSEWLALAKESQTYMAGKK